MRQVDAAARDRGPERAEPAAWASMACRSEPRRDIGMVFQTPTLLPWTDVLGNVLFPLKVLRRCDRDGIDRATR